jgi:hypothetical protein
MQFDQLKKTQVHHAAWRRGGCVAAYGGARLRSVRASECLHCSLGEMREARIADFVAGLRKLVISRGETWIWTTVIPTVIPNG